MPTPSYDELRTLSRELRDAPTPEVLSSLQAKAEYLLSQEHHADIEYLEQDRQAEAEEVYMAADIGDVVDANGWEWTSPGSTMSRTVFLSPDVSGDPSRKATFAVGFADGSVSVESATLDGEDVMPALRLQSDDSPSM